MEQMHTKENNISTIDMQDNMKDTITTMKQK